MGWRVPEIGEKVVVKHPDFQSSQDGIKSGDVGKVVGIIGDDYIEEVLLLLNNPAWTNMCVYHSATFEGIVDYSSNKEEVESCLVYIRECDLLEDINEDEVEL